ncbi:hypothetical protein PFY12_01610 [Chryseobacterium camelliae]|uniref:DUF4468 domain-containing protein n=1 Tax=Chryseobacterium camelliae TaxID=1265445 RepID=A0ABY7QMD8_9FLAO|nr:hypothetical protein [Chryseobacterium camelliae]WBV60829.1 hypothetical protein PFY12_01610 [Chryseobacterium camelliae]
MTKKLIIPFAFFLQSLYAPAQVQKIVKILNREIQKEVKAQQQDSANYYGEKFELIKPYSIKDSLEGKHKILILETRKKDSYKNVYYTVKQQVELSKVKAIVKDINIIFTTEPNASKVTETDENGKEENYNGDLFFLNLSHEKKNEKLADELIHAFKKAGYSIRKDYWYD